MSEKIGRFEIVSQLAQPPFATVYKAVDSENQQTVALKVVDLTGVNDRDALLKQLFEEADQAKPLNSHNIAALYGVGDEADQLLAATEYVQGNSIATTLARHEGFSIWDLQDVARQVCHAIDHANVHNVVHCSIEPAKIMIQWDGLVKVLGFGISRMNGLAASTADRIPDVLYYASPEQLRGEVCDHRSMLYSLGAVLYEMATEQKPFTGETAEQIKEAILEKLPVQPVRLKANLNRGLSDLIMKALAKSPEERYQSGQELVRDLEQCKSGASVPAAAMAANQPPKPAQTSGQKPKAFAAAVGGSPTSRISGTPNSSPNTSASAAPAVEEPKPSFAVDPMMAGENAAAPSKSFSDIAELPPLKEVRISMPAHAAEEPEEALPTVVLNKKVEEKPRAQAREAAQKAVAEIRKTPPKLYLSAIAGAVALIVLIVVGMALNNYLQDRDQSGSGSSIQRITGAPMQPAPAQSAPAPAATTPQSAAEQSEPTESSQAEEPETQDSTAPAPATHGRKSKQRGPAIVAAQLTVNSTPEDAQITFDGSALCQSPCTLTGIAPGQHTVSASKPGFSTASRELSISSGVNTSVALQLTQLGAILSVASTPAGAVIVIDGKDTGKLTPSQFSVSGGGTHTVSLQRSGYLDATSTVTLAVGQTSTVNLSLTHLGNTDEIRAAGGKFKKMFGGGGSTSGMGVVSIKTQPKGAQIMLNNRVLDKTSPFDFYLNPGTYVIDITMEGYRPLHRVITVQEGEKLEIQEPLTPQ